MKLLLLFMCSCISGVLFSDWKLASVYNQSDLKLDGAYRLTNKLGKKKKSATFVDKRVKSAASKPFVVIDYKVLVEPRSQGYLCISLKNKFNQVFDLCFDSQPKHAIEWHRSKTTQIVAHDATPSLLAETSDDSLIARAVLKLQDTILVQAVQPYDVEQNGVEFDLTIKGASGSYTLELSQAT